MNFKALNIKKGLKRIWIIGSVLLFLFPLFTGIGILGNEIDGFYGRSYEVSDMLQFLSVVTYSGICIGLWWGVLYLGFWIARGFVDDDKKAGF